MLMGNLQGPMRKEIVKVIDQKLQSCEISQDKANTQIDLEKKIKTQHQKMMSLQQLQAEEATNTSRSNNNSIKGTPETVIASQLRETVMSILNRILENPPDTQIELDWVHRVPIMRYSTQATPRDILCRVHIFRIK